MENSSPTTPELTITDHATPLPRSGWRRYLRFPKSWKEVKSLGWKFVLAFILFYLIRDSILYLLIPYLVYRGILS